MTSARRTRRAVTARVPAKVNLDLLRRAPPDRRLPPLSTVFQAVVVYDDVTVEPADDWQASRSPARTPTWCRSTAPTSRCARRAACADVAGVAEPRAHHDRQGHPGRGRHGGRVGRRRGRAGGLRRAVGPGLAAQRPATSLAAALGADVPFGLHGGTAVGSGRGDH